MAARSLGRYELLRLLGRGGMAEVFLARRRVAGLEKRLVIKRIRPERAGDTRFLELFVREARLSMTLNHQNIVPVFDFGRIGDAAFLAMEHVEGRDLGSTLARTNTALPPLLAAFIAAECGQALAHAHGRRGPDGVPLGVVHRDVTPRNVLLSWAGEVKLSDFGVAALAGDADGAVRGTPAYMAPEQARNQRVDARADLYALGLVLWELLTGARVRRNRTNQLLLEEARTGALPALPGGPADLVAIVARATREQPDERYPDAEAMLAALDRYLVAARAAAPGPAPARQLADWLRGIWGDAAVEATDVAGDVDALPTSDRALPDPATMRSLADTVAAADGEPAASPAPAPGPAPSPSPDLAVRRGRRRVGTLIAVGVVAASAAVALAIARRDGRGVAGGGPGDARAIGLAVIDGSVADAAPADAPARPGDAGAIVLAVIDGSVADAALADAPARPADAREPVADASRAPTGAAPVGRAPPSTTALPGAADTAPVAAVRRKVTIGATPWADFTVDDDPTPHQTPETVELAPGRHRVHFSNPRLGVTRTVSLDVPADRDLTHVEDLTSP